MRVKTLIEIPSARGIIPVGQIIEIPPTVMEKLKGKVELLHSRSHTPNPNTASAEIVEKPETVDAIWQNPYAPGSIEARRESLQQVMAAVLITTFDRVAAMWPQGFVSTPEIRAAEIEIKRVQSLVLSGRGRIADLRQALERWERIIIERT
jgi:hypothetical protein